MRNVLTVIIASYSDEEVDRLKDIVLHACKVINLRMTNNVQMDKRMAKVLSFEVQNMIFFPSILDNFRENKERLQLTMSAYFGDKKVDLNKIK